MGNGRSRTCSGINGTKTLEKHFGFNRLSNADGG